MEHQQSPQKAWTIFKELQQQFIQMVLPCKKSSKKSKPWFNVKIKRLCKQKYQADRQRRNPKNPKEIREKWHAVYKSLKKKVTIAVKHAKIAYHDIKIEHLSTTDSRTFWTEVKKTFDYTENMTCHLNLGNQRITKPQEKADLFNKTFTDISKIDEQAFSEEKDFHEEIREQTHSFLQEKKMVHQLHEPFLIDEIQMAIRISKQQSTR